MKKIISACLCGINCKYNGGNNLHPCFEELLRTGEVFPVCPEQLGGLSTPREACEIMAGSGLEVLKGEGRVINQDNQDMTTHFLKGAYETLNITRKIGANYALLKSFSPSCGVGQVYDGSFSSKIIAGDGVTAALLRKNGITVVSDRDFLSVLKR